MLGHATRKLSATKVKERRPDRISVTLVSESVVRPIEQHLRFFSDLLQLLLIHIPHHRYQRPPICIHHNADVHLPPHLDAVPCQRRVHGGVLPQHSAQHTQQQVIVGHFQPILGYPLA